MSKELLIAGGFAYSEIDPLYFNVKSAPYRRLFTPVSYKSKVTGAEYPYIEYAPIEDGKQGMKPLRLHEYPYAIIYTANSLTANR